MIQTSVLIATLHFLDLEDVSTARFVAGVLVFNA